MGPFQNPFKRSQPASSASPVTISLPIVNTSPIQQTYQQPSSPVRTLESTYSPTAPISPTFARSTPRKRMESNGVAFEAVEPTLPEAALSKRTSTRRTRNRQPTVTESGTAPSPRQRSFSHYIIPGPEQATHTATATQQQQQPYIKASTLPIGRPRIIRRASSMDNIIAHSAKTQQAKSPRSKLSAARAPGAHPLLDRIQTNGSLGTSSPTSVSSASSPRSAGSSACSSGVSTPLSSVPPKKAAALLGLTSTPRQTFTTSRTSSIISNNYSPLPTPPNSAKLRAKSANGVRTSRKPSSPSVTARNSDFFFPASLGPCSRADSAALKLSMITGDSRHVIGEVDTSEDLTITLRGDRHAVTGLQVMLVCIAEGNETVWELRVKRPRPSTSPISSSALPSPAASFTAIYTPPCEDPNMHKSCYFSAPTPVAHSNPALLSPKANRRPSPLILSASPNGRSPRLGTASPTRSKASSPVPTAFCPVTPKRRRFISESSTRVVSDVHPEEDAASSQGFTNLYQGLADAYRSAHLEAEGEDVQRGLLPAPSGMVACSSSSPPPSASSGSSSSFAAAQRSPEHRYALYMPNASSCATSSSSCTSENILTPTEERTLVSESDWQGYSSSIVDGYNRASGYPFPVTGPSPSNTSPPTSPSALLQRRLAGKTAFNLGLGVRDVHDMMIPEAALKRLGEQRGSVGSISLKGREGWSETEPENDSESTDAEETILDTESLYHHERED